MVKYKAGQVILEDKPFAHVLNVSQRGKRCDQCFKICLNLQRCSQCKVKYYCSRSCQAEDWKSGHKLSECSIYAKDLRQFNGSLVNTDHPRLVLRLLLLLTNKPELKAKTLGTNLTDGSPRSWDFLMDHKDNLLKDRGIMRLVENMCYWYTSLGVSVDRDLVLSIFGKICINGFTFKESTCSSSIVGFGVFIGASQFDHSCKPNVVTFLDGTRLKILAMTDIDTQLEPMSITYIDITLPTDKRKEILANEFYFNCCCFRCNSRHDIDMDLLHDRLIQLGQLINEGNWIQADDLGRQMLPVFEDYFHFLTYLFILLNCYKSGAI